MKKYLNSFYFILIISTMCFLYRFSLRRNNQKGIKAIQVEFNRGNANLLNRKIIDKLLKQNIKDFKNNTNTSSVLNDLETRISENPYVEKANVFLTINRVLKTHIEQRIPIARIENQTKSYYIDKYGVKIPISENYSVRVPLVSGVKTNSDIEQITKLSDKILKDNFLKKEIIGIRKLADKTYIFAVRSGDYKIIFGKLINMDIKFAKLKAFYNKALADKTIFRYKTIDVKYRNQVVCAK